MIKQLVEKREEFAAKQKKVAKIFEEGGSDAGGNSRELDLEKVKSLEGDSRSKLDQLRKMSEELDALGKEIDELASLDLLEKNLAKEHEVKGGGDTHRFTGRQDSEPKGIGDLFVESEAYKNHQAGMSWRGVSAGIKGGAMPLLKTTFSTSAGWAPETTRIGRMIDEALRPIQVIDFIPGGQTGQAAIKYMEETTVTSAAAERSEGGAYAESTLALTERSQTVRSLGTSIPVTDEQLADVPEVRSYLNMRLGFLVRQKLDSQLLVGSGTGSPAQILGINNFSGIQTQAKGSDPTPDAFYKGMVKVQVTGRALPNLIIIHPNDWQSIRLLRTTDGVYIWGNPSEAGPMRMWGLMVVSTDAQTEGTGLVGDTANFCQLFMRQDVTIEIGLDSDDFTKGTQTVRAGLRAAMVGYRPAAFCQITGI